jgi:DNA-binding transcriptional LysR family regulator
MATRAQYPEITLQLTEELTGNLSDQLKSGRVNLAVLFDDGQLASLPPRRWRKKNCTLFAVPMRPTRKVSNHLHWNRRWPPP